MLVGWIHLRPLRGPSLCPFHSSTHEGHQDVLAEDPNKGSYWSLGDAFHHLEIDRHAHEEVGEGCEDGGEVSEDAGDVICL